jgi:hypothetical protein
MYDLMILHERCRREAVGAGTGAADVESRAASGARGRGEAVVSGFNKTELSVDDLRKRVRLGDIKSVAAEIRPSDTQERIAANT